MTSNNCGQDADEPLYLATTGTHLLCEYRNGIPCDPCNELANIEAEIEDLHSRSKDLPERHRQARESRNYVHSPLTHGFPPEVVSHIFSLAFPPRDTTPCCRSEERASPLIIAQVCHRWRIIAMSMPGLWSDISVDVRRPNFPLLNHHVAHSGMLPLSIYLFAPWFTRGKVPEAKQVMSWAIKHLHRTASFYVNFPGSFTDRFESVTHSDIPTSVPFLQELHVHRVDCSKLRFAIEPPRPQRLVLTGFYLNHAYLDWTNISSLKLSSRSVDVIPPKLLASQYLKNLDLGLGLRELPREQVAVLNRSIQDLTLSNFESTELILTMATLPFLQKLDIHISEMREIRPIICNFLHRSLCPLQVFCICDCSDGSDRASMQEMIRILENMNMLHQFTLQILGDPPTSWSFEPLVRRLLSQDGSFLPCLETFSLATRFSQPIGLLLDVLETDGSESTNGPDTVRRPLRTILLEQWLPSGVNAPISRDEVLRILRLRAAGNTISIVSFMDTDFVEYWKNSYGLTNEN